MMMTAGARQATTPSMNYRRNKRLSRSAHDRRKPLNQAVLRPFAAERRAITANINCIKDGRNIDPCCGGAFLLTALGFLHGDKIERIYASDIDKAVLALAEKNLSLLTPEGLERRIEQPKTHIALYKKDSHREALESAYLIASTMKHCGFQPSIECFSWNITKRETCKNPARFLDMVITDLPYGALVQWHGEADVENASERLLEGILPLLKNQGITAVISGKRVVLKHPSFQKSEGFKIGKRHVLILAKTESS